MLNIKINKNKIFIFILALFFFKPPSLEVIAPTIGNLYDIGLLISFSICCINLIRSKAISQLTIAIFIFKFILFIITLYNNGDYLTVLKNSIVILGISFFFDYFKEKNIKELVSSLKIILQILVYINFITILIYPHGMYLTKFAANYFLGYDNVHITFILPAMILTVLDMYLENKKSIASIIFIIVCNLSVFLRWSATSIGMIIVIDCFLLCSPIFMKLKILNIYNYIISYIIVFVGIVFVRIQSLFKKLIVNVLKKDLTFTGRITIWDNNINYIKNNLMFGYGQEYENMRIIKNYGFSHAHNQILEFLYQGGIVLFVSFLSVLGLSVKKLYTYRNNYISKFLSICILAILLSMLFEVYRKDYLWMIYILSYNVKYFINN